MVRVRKRILSLLELTTSFTSAPSFMHNKVKRNPGKVSCFNCKNVKRGTSVLRVRSKQASFFFILWPFYCWHEAFFTLQQSFLSFSRKKANISGLRFQKSVVVLTLMFHIKRTQMTHRFLTWLFHSHLRCTSKIRTCFVIEADIICWTNDVS